VPRRCQGVAKSDIYDIEKGEASGLKPDIRFGLLREIEMQLASHRQPSELEDCPCSESDSHPLDEISLLGWWRLQAIGERTGLNMAQLRCLDCLLSKKRLLASPSHVKPSILIDP
jgi:hypothetical protein